MFIHVVCSLPFFSSSLCDPKSRDLNSHVWQQIYLFRFFFFLSPQAVERDFWCAPPFEMSKFHEMNLSEWRRISQPHGACQTINTSGLSLHNVLDWASLNHSTGDLTTCDRFVFDPALSETTIQSEWNVVCEDATFLSVIEMCFLAGAAMGSLSSGALSDEYGRRHSLMFFVALQAAIGESISHNCFTFYSTVRQRK